MARNLAKIAVKKRREKKEVAKNLIPRASVSKRPCQPIFPVKRVPSRSIPLLPPPISFQPFRTKFIQRETILEKDLNSISLSLSPSFEGSYILLRIICELKMLIRLSFSGRAANFNYSDRRIGRIIVAKKTRGSRAHNRFVLILLTHLGCSCTFLRLEADAMCIRAFIRDLHSRREACLYVFFLLTRI